MEKVEEKNVIKNKAMNLEKIIKERVDENINLFNNGEIDLIKNNKRLVEKIYLLGMLDIL